jgi:hypothetical protein
MIFTTFIETFYLQSLYNVLINISDEKTRVNVPNRNIYDDFINKFSFGRS